MKPEHFIREFGEKKAREVVEGAHSWADVLLAPTGEYCSICIPPDDADEFVSIEDLKRLVESVDRVNAFGGLKDAKAVVKMGKHYKYLKAHISNYESIYGGGDE
ncbi:hypothetical protein [Acinetobacter baumannii]|uniref:hypothetical protein n=1 Tax=Acinetobacter baumannii TaxID=470 RepID=UPI000A345650|nr:hypothetical protein [Acinetobacter baumannii]OTS28918.1 hypothetical protein CAT07_12095 [Acinetobacter baumannii]